MEISKLQKRVNLIEALKQALQDRSSEHLPQQIESYLHFSHTTHEIHRFYITQNQPLTEFPLMNEYLHQYLSSREYQVETDF